MEHLIKLYKKESNDAFISISNSSIVDFVNLIIKAYQNEKKVFACGNGGNVASVQNLVLDLNMHPFVSEDKSKRKGKRNQFQAISLCDSSAAITGMTNDIGFENIFAEQLRYQASEGDILFAMSGSGNSKNIVSALAWCNDRYNISTALISGQKSNCLDEKINEVCFEKDYFHTVEILSEMTFYQLIHGTGNSCPTIKSELIRKYGRSDAT